VLCSGNDRFVHAADEQQSRAVAEALSIREVVSEPDSSLFVDVTVRLGPEWSLLPDSTEDDLAHRPWWDPRRYLNKNDGNEGSRPTGL